MAEVARQVLMIVGSGERQGVIRIETLKFPGAGAPQSILSSVCEYLALGGVSVLAVDHSPWAHLFVLQVSVTDRYNSEPFGEDYQAFLREIGVSESL